VGSRQLCEDATSVVAGDGVIGRGDDSVADAFAEVGGTGKAPDAGVAIFWGLSFVLPQAVARRARIANNIEPVSCTVFMDLIFLVN
jgi:hypothetical protein